MWAYGLPAPEGVTLLMGLLTVVAALAVAVVASAWRPSDLELQVELAASRAVDTFGLAGRMVAVLAIVVAVLAVPQSQWPVSVRHWWLRRSVSPLRSVKMPAKLLSAFTTEAL